MEAEGEVEEEVAGEVWGPEGVSRPCRHRRSPYPLLKSTEMPAGAQKRVKESFCLSLFFLKSLTSC